MRFQPPGSKGWAIPFPAEVVAYIKSLVQPFSGAGSGGGSGGVTSVAGSTVITASPTTGAVIVGITAGTNGQVLETVGGVPTWATPSAGHGVTTLTANFTIPAVNVTGSMSVADAFAFTQGQTFLIPNGTTVDQQGYIGQVVSGGGVSGAATVTVITRSLGTYSAAGTIASGSTVTWGDAATIIGSPPSPLQSTSAADGTGSITLTLGATPNVGDDMYTVLTSSAGVTFTTLAGWTLLGVITTASGAVHVTMAVYWRHVQAGDGTTYTWTASTIRSAYLVEVPGIASSLQQFVIFDSSGESFSPTTPPLSPNTPNSLVLSMFCMGNGFVAGAPAGWAELDSITNSGDIANLAILQGPPTTTSPIESTATTSDTAASAMLILPPSAVAGSGGVAGITVANLIQNTGTAVNPVLSLTSGSSRQVAQTISGTPQWETIYPVAVTDIAAGVNGTFLETVAGVPTWSTGGGSGGGGTFTSSGTYTIPAVNSSGTITLTANWGGIAPAYIQFAAGGTTPFIGLVTAGGGTTSLTVTTLQTGGTTTIPSGSTGAFAGPSAGLEWGGGGQSAYLSTVQGRATIQHLYKCNETSGTACVDSVGSTNGTYHNTPTFGNPAICGSDTNGTPLLGGNATLASCPYLVIPVGAFPASGTAFWIELLYYAIGQQSMMNCGAQDVGSNSMGWDLGVQWSGNGAASDAANYPGTTTFYTYSGTQGRPTSLAFHYDGTSVQTWYINGALLVSETKSLSALYTNGMAFGAQPFNSAPIGNAGVVLVQYIAVYSNTFTVANLIGNVVSANQFR